MNENDINVWKNPQLRNMLFLKNIIDDKLLPKTKKRLFNLWVEWKNRSETDWIIVKEQVRED